MDNDKRTRKALQVQNQLSEEQETAVENAIKGLMRHRDGRLFIWWLLCLGKEGHNPYRSHALDTAFACGEMNVGLQIKSRIMELTPEDYIKMIVERNDDDKRVSSELRSGYGDKDDSE